MERWILFALLSMLFAGFTSVIARFGMKDLSSDVALAFRTVVVFAIIAVNAFVFHSAWSGLRNTHLSNLVFLGISGITTALSWIFYYRAIKEGPVSYVAAIDKASLLVTLLLSFVLLKEPVSPKILIGAGLILSGTLVLTWK
jgi:transporter family protein